MITPDVRDKIRAATQQMIEDGADESTINEFLAKTKAKYDPPISDGQAGGMGDVKMAESPAGPPAYKAPPSSIFPSASQVQEPQAQAMDRMGMGGMVAPNSPVSAKRLALGTGDLLSLPTRALAAAITDQQMSDPDAYALKSLVESGKFNTSGTREDEQAQAMDRMGLGGLVAPNAPMGARSLANLGIEQAGRAASDPLSYATLLAKTLTYIPEVAKAAGMGLEDLGSSQMNRVIKPLMRHERSARTPIEQVIFDQGLDKGGASPKAIYEKSSTKLNQLGAKLKAEIRAGRDNGARINTNDIIDQAVADFKASPGSKAAEAGQAPGESEDFYSMAPDLEEIANDFKARAQAANPEGAGSLDLLQGHGFKKYLGHEGAWQQIAQSKGIPLSAKETARSKFAEDIYHRVNDAIDAGAPNGIKDLNKQISDLIPVNQAAGWRQIIDARNNAISLNDVIGMTATALNPKIWPIVALNKATKSGTVASKVYRLGEALKSIPQPSAKAKSLWGALRKPIGEVQKARLADLLASELQSQIPANTIPFRRQATEDNPPSEYITRR